MRPPSLTPSTKSKNDYNVAIVSCSNLDNIEKKIEDAVDGLPFHCFNLLHNRVLPANKENALTICDYISSLKSEINPSDHYRKDTIIQSSFVHFQYSLKMLNSTRI
jgi:hypothetical protein